MCDDGGGLTSAQIATLNAQKDDVQKRQGEVGQYFQEMSNLSNQKYQIDRAGALDKFLMDSYNIQKKTDTDIVQGKGLTDFETMYDNTLIQDTTSKSFDRQAELQKLDFVNADIERNKSRFDQLAQLEDQLYQIDTELQG